MAATKALVYLFSILVPLVLVYSQDAPPSPPNSPEGPSPGGPNGGPNGPGGPNAPGGQNASGEPGSPAAGPGGPSESDDGDHQERLFFSFPLLTTCNATSEAGRTCRSCTESLTCLSNNVGFIRVCHGFLPFCNGGRCSFIAGSACNSTSGR